MRPGADASVDTQAVREQDAAPGRNDVRAAADTSGAEAAKPDAGICNHELDNTACWSTFSTQQATSYTQNFAGVVFDGRYVTFVNSSSGPTLRYDTSASFSERTAWSSVSPGDSFCEGGAFDGRYLYLLSGAPDNNGAGGLTYDAKVYRYDTQKAPAISGSKEQMNVSKALNTADLMVPGARGAAFDGRYLYLAPSGNGEDSGIVVRYDTTVGFIDSSSWSTFDATKVAANARGYAGAVFDGKYVYFVPYSSKSSPADAGSTSTCLVLRFDSTASFADKASWSTFDAATLTPSPDGFFGASFDGRYLYFAPSGSTKKGIVPVRYDTQGGFADPGSWRAFDIKYLDTAWGGSSLRFAGSVFDGRYVYFIPSVDELLVRYDAQADFATAAAWSSFDMFKAGAYGGSKGAAFDGRYLYLASTGLGTIMRFDAKERGPLPPGHNASFY